LQDPSELLRGQEVNLQVQLGSLVCNHRLSVLITSTNVERKIASRETIVVSSPNGNGSKGRIPKSLILRAIHTPNEATWSQTKPRLPEIPVIKSAIFS
jgi:hypothetical protein